jgi:hypothetical protein
MTSFSPFFSFVCQCNNSAFLHLRRLFLLYLALSAFSSSSFLFSSTKIPWEEGGRLFCVCMFMVYAIVG